MVVISKNNRITRLLKLIFPAILLFLSLAFVLQKEDWKAPESAQKKKNPIEADAANLAAGKKSYEKECLSCHGRKGKGDGPSSMTLEVLPGNLSQSKVQDQTDGELYWKITEGKKPMPSTKLTLSDEQRWQVVNYIRTLKK